MQTPTLEHEALIEPLEGRCLGCFRPRRDCFCAMIPSIANRTEVLIVQHVRERFHRFNTARIVHRSLQNSSLLVDQTAQLAQRLQLHPRAGLLYPGANARLISDIPADERPEQLVILDGTWHHAKTFVRDIPALAELPCFRLAPTELSRYRIRREPSAVALSTVEATVAALRVLEPDTAGLDQLLTAFDWMIERQLAHPKTGYSTRRNQRRNRGCGNIPRVLLGDAANIIVAYGESAAGQVGSDRSRRSPVYWVAQRLGTGECFGCRIKPERPLDDAFLGHLELARDDFAVAVTLETASAAWNQFVRPSDTVVVYNKGTVHLLDVLSGTNGRHLLLKAVDFNPQRRYTTLDELLAGELLVPPPPQHAGRAGKRLANALALVRHLRTLGHAAMLPECTPESVSLRYPSCS